MDALLPDYLDDRRDRAVLGQLPLVMAPRFGELPDPRPGEQRLVGACDGLYIEARSPALWVRWPVASVPLPYGPVEQFMRPAHGPVPVDFLHGFQQAAHAASPQEAAALIVAEGGHYAYKEVAVSSRSGAHITYEDLDADACESLVIDMHSHGRGGSMFSPTDDKSDTSRPGPHISLVLGRCQSLYDMELSVRLCVGGYLLPIEEKLGNLGVAE